MKQCTETITVLNRRYNPAIGLDEWTPTVIHGVSWHSRIDAAVIQTGQKAKDAATVRIPVGADTGGRTYMTPTAYKAAESVSEAFTLARGDLIVRGTVTTPTTGRLAPANIQQTYEDSFTITSVSDNTRRPHGPHWKVVGA